jgi:hypothetical protein
MLDTSEPEIDRIEFLGAGQNLPAERRRVAAPAELDTTDNGFNWTREELEDATRIAMDRLYLGDNYLDDYLPRRLHLDRVEVRVAKEKVRIGEEAYQALARRYL